MAIRENGCHCTRVGAEGERPSRLGNRKAKLFFGHPTPISTPGLAIIIAPTLLSCVDIAGGRWCAAKAHLGLKRSKWAVAHTEHGGAAQGELAPQQELGGVVHALAGVGLDGGDACAGRGEEPNESCSGGWKVTKQAEVCCSAQAICA